VAWVLYAFVGAALVSSLDPRSADPRRDSVRYTVDLDRQQHRVLKLLALDLRASASSIFRALLELTEEDGTLVDRVRKRLDESAMRRH